MSRVLRSIWLFFNAVMATLIMGGLTIVAAPVDRHKRVVRYFAKWWAWWLLWSTGLHVSVDGRKNLEPDRQYIFIGNHTSALDIPLALALLPGPVIFLAKRELFRIVFFGWAIRALGCIPVDRSSWAKARQSVEKALQLIRQRTVSVLLYPEGGRSRDGRLQRFKRGGFLLALRTHLPVVPVAVKGAFEAAPPHARSVNPSTISVTIDQPIETTQLSENDDESLLRDVYERISTLLAMA
jgi:1-acyl-sn-glycerol-3-phosphate acyltransferase